MGNANYNEVHLQRIITETLRIDWKDIQSPRGHDDRRKRRVVVWAYSSLLGWQSPNLQKQFGIQSRQSIQKILKSASLCEDEYNWRRLVSKKWDLNKS